MPIETAVARYGGQAGVALFVAGGVGSTVLDRGSELPVELLVRAALLLAALVFAVRLVIVALDPEGAVEAGMTPPLRNVDVAVSSRSDLWKPAAFDAVGVVVCLAMAVLAPPVSGF
jgi:hypothetical protein